MVDLCLFDRIAIYENYFCLLFLFNLIMLKKLNFLNFFQLNVAVVS